MDTKTCSKCAETKTLDLFYTKLGRPTSWCKACTLADSAARHRKAHPHVEWVMPAEKKCTKCGVTKPIDQFHKRSSAKDGHYPSCSVCTTAASLAFNKAHPEYHRQKAREYAKRHPDRKADNSLKWRLGIPWGTYAQMLEAQDGKCAICQTTNPGVRLRRFHVDHDKDTGEVRGLLCSTCNLGIGYLKHSKEILLGAIEYLALSKRSVT